MDAVRRHTKKQVNTHTHNHKFYQIYYVIDHSLGSWPLGTLWHILWLIHSSHIHSFFYIIWPFVIIKYIFCHGEFSIEGLGSNSLGLPFHLGKSMGWYEEQMRKMIHADVLLGKMYVYCKNDSGALCDYKQELNLDLFLYISWTQAPVHSYKRIDKHKHC